MAGEAEQVQVTPAEPVTPAPTSVVDQYELGDTSPEPIESTGNVTSGQEDNPGKPRDPETGRFLSTGNVSNTPPEAPKPPSHSQRLLRMAADFGISEAEANGMTPDQLDATVYAAHRATLQTRQERSISDSVGNRPAPVQTQPAQAQEPDEPFDLGLKEDDYDPALVGALKKLATSSARTIKELKSQIAQLSQREQARAQESFAERVDRHFEKHAAILGEGRGLDMNADSEAYEKRLAVLNSVSRMPGGVSQANIDRAVAKLFGTHAPALPATDPKAVQKWNDGGVAKPTNRAGATEPKGPERAKKAAAEYLKTNSLVSKDEAESADFL